MKTLGVAKMACIVFVFCAATAIGSPAQTFTTLVNFDGSNGSWAQQMSLVQGTDGAFYGTTGGGGANCSPFGCGTVFKITTEGELTTLHSFSFAGSRNPMAGLVQATDGNFYGTTVGGGTKGFGTVFKITAEGKLTTLHNFHNSDGADPWAGLVQATDGNLYGTAQLGGDLSCGVQYGCGTVFKITPEGKFTTLHIFHGSDGEQPIGELIQGADGNFYGTTFGGYGTVFRMTPDGRLTTLHTFDGADGSSLFSGLVQATDGDFYGTTWSGGAHNAGTVFRMTTDGKLTTLYSFCSQTGCTDGGGPAAPLVQATDGNFYGTTEWGGANDDCYDVGCGTVFKITARGELTTLHTFDGSDGSNITDGLVQATNGTFYGTSYGGGSSTNCPEGNGCGTVFSLSVGLGPFVKTNPTSGKVKTKVTILGTDLSGATSVTFNGVEATFTVVSNSEITTTVPIGATTGRISVTTPKRTLKSNLAFRVKP